MLEKSSHLKKFNDRFQIRMKIAQFAVPLIVLGKMKVFYGVQIHPKKILERASKVRK